MQTQPIDIEKIVVLDNYRKIFQQDTLQELAESIKQIGILQAVTVRPFGEDGSYELIIGERRLRAAILAGLSHIPATIRLLTDEEADEIRLIENIQRADAHPLNESEGILRLVRGGKTYKEVADRLGKSESYVTQRLSLNNLIDHWKTLFYEGGLNLSGAFQIARLSESNQEKLTGHFRKEALMHDGKYVQVIAPQAIKDFVQKYFFLNLNLTDFKKDDADLYPEAGSCLQCSRRTGCNQLLFAELTQDDFCTESACFEEKNNRHLTNQTSKLQAENIPYHQLSTSSYVDNRNIISKYDYTVVENEEQESETGIIVHGQSIGKIVQVRLYNKKSVALTPESKKEATEKRRAVIRGNRIKKSSQRLAGIRVIDAFKKAKPKDQVFAAMLDYLIIERIGYGQSKEFLDHFIERYGWNMPLDRTNYSIPTGMIASCIRDTPASRKLEMLVDTYVHQKAIAEWGTDIEKLTQYIGLDWNAILEEASNQVDVKYYKKAMPISQLIPAAA